MSDKRPDTLLDEYRNYLTGRMLEGANKAPRLRIKVPKSNTPSIHIQTGINDDRDRASVNIPFNDYHAFFGFLEMLSDLANTTTDVEKTHTMQVMHKPFINGRPSQEIKVCAIIRATRSADGDIRLSITTPKFRNSIIFDMMFDGFCNYQTASGEGMPRALASRLTTLSWVKMLQLVVTEAMAISYVRPDFLDRDRPGYGNSNTSNGDGNMKSYGKPNNNYDDDIPF